MRAMRGHVGDVVFYWLEDGIHLMLWREWKGPKLEPGEEKDVARVFADL